MARKSYFAEKRYSAYLEKTGQISPEPSTNQNVVSALTLAEEMRTSAHVKDLSTPGSLYIRGLTSDDPSYHTSTTPTAPSTGVTTTTTTTKKKRRVTRRRNASVGDNKESAMDDNRESAAIQQSAAPTQSPPTTTKTAEMGWIDLFPIVQPITATDNFTNENKVEVCHSIYI